MVNVVDGQVKCEKWIRDDDDQSEESKAIRWLNRLIGRTKKANVDWRYPFVEGRMFVLTLSAGLEGYHISVDGRHVTSFPYRTVSANYSCIVFPCIVIKCRISYNCVCIVDRDLFWRMPLDCM